VQEIYPVTDLDQGLVGWDSQDDPMHPRNYPKGRKSMLLGFVSGIAFLRYDSQPGWRSVTNKMSSPLSSSIIAPGISFMNKEFHNTSEILTTFTVSIFVLGFAVSHHLLTL